MFFEFTIFLFLASLLYFVPFVNRHFVRKEKNLTKYGSWAVVTGATDGIGKAIAEALAKRKMNVFLISRTQSKLDQLAQDIESKYSVETKTLSIDFSVEGSNKFNAFRSAAQSLDIGILVNNVGVSYDHAQFYHELDSQTIQNLVRVNIEGTIEMTNAVLPGMLQRKRGSIINVSSASSLVSEPLYAVYSATKAFINNYSVALHHEYKSKGVFVQTQLPAYVVSKMSKIRKSSIMVATPEQFASAFVKQIGYEPFVIPYWSHDLQLSASKLLPSSVLANLLLSKGLDVRTRALKKKAQ